MEHPVRTSSPELGRHPVLVDRYVNEGRRDTTSYTEDVVKYHRRLASIVNRLIGAGWSWNGWMNQRHHRQLSPRAQTSRTTPAAQPS